jgi:hypothetical protein
MVVFAHAAPCLASAKAEGSRASPRAFAEIMGSDVFVFLFCSRRLLGFLS